MEEQKQTEEEQAYSDGGTADAKRGIQRGTESEWLISETVDKLVPPLLALASTFIPWFTAEISSGTTYGVAQSFTGLDMFFGQVVAVTSLTIILVTWISSDRLGGWSRYVGGSIILLSFFGQLTFQSSIRNQLIDEAPTSVNSYVVEVSASSELGLWVALLAGVLIIGVERKRRKQLK